MTQISPMLAVSDGKKAIEFYKAAFGAEVLWLVEHDGQVVAGLEIDGAKFFLAHESPDYGTRGPSSAGFTTVRIELFVDDPAAVYKQAVAAGATDRDRVKEYEYEMSGPKPIRKMLQGSVVDPFGHKWLIGKILE
jgi:PhnB protein